MTDATVYVAIGKRDTRTVYHSREDCGQLPARAREWPLSRAEEQDLRECKWCAEAVNHSGAKDLSYYHAAANADVDPHGA